MPKFEMRLQAKAAMEVLPLVLDATTEDEAKRQANEGNPGWEVFSIWKVAE